MGYYGFFLNESTNTIYNCSKPIEDDSESKGEHLGDMCFRLKTR